MHVRSLIGLAALAAVQHSPAAWAVSPPPNACAAALLAYPQPGRLGFHADNSFMPLPDLAPARAGGGAGTLSLSLNMTHLDTDTGGPGAVVFIGNYPVTNLPMLRTVLGAGPAASMTDPASGNTIALPPSCLLDPSIAFAGTRWQVQQGDKLDIVFRSSLDYTGPVIQVPLNGSVPCRSSNLHTHGLLVSPYHPALAGVGPYGDYVLDVTQPRGSKDFGSRTDDCGTDLGGVAHHGHGLTNLPLHYITDIPGTPHVNSLVTGQHPSGMFWFHPHPHGMSKVQVEGGTTGVITIGDLTDYACAPGGPPGKCSLANTDVRVLALKDTQILPLGHGTWSVLQDESENIHNYDPGFCDPQGGVRHGECQSTEGNGGKWVFTVNGVQYPVMHVPAGRGQVWRILNASPNISYHLHIVGSGGTSLPFQLLAKDGASIADRVSHGSLSQEVLLMPASRLELYIPPPKTPGRYVLRNEVAETGANGGGDTWPQVDLAAIEWHAPPATALGDAAPAAAAAALAVSAPEGMHSTPVSGFAHSTALPPNCSFGAGDTRVVYYVHRYNTIGNEIFGLMASIRHADGTEDFFDDRDPSHVLHSAQAVWKEGINGPDMAFPGLGHNHFSSICTVKGNVEPWELQNWTSENHNFHIHQSKFTIDPNGASQFPRVIAGEDGYIRDTDRVLKGFLGRVASGLNDTVPLPRGQSFCSVDPTLPGCTPTSPDDNLECTGEPQAARCANPGKLTVLMDFSRNEQVGTFVYHCHILEHEDGGMMALVTVMCPPGDTACALLQPVAAPICRPHGQEFGAAVTRP